MARALVRSWLTPARRAGVLDRQPPDETGEEQSVLGDLRSDIPSVEDRRELRPASTEMPRGRSATPLPSGGARDLDPALRAFIGRLIGRSIPPVRVHTGRAGDIVARRFDADAVTARRDVFFRSGQFDPATPRGLALLGHELTHVAQMSRSSDQTSRRTAAPAVDSREADALGVERALLAGGPPSPLVVSPPPAPPPGQTPQAPMAAARGRDAGSNEGAARTTALTEREMTAIKEEVYRDLRQRLRVEFERGA